WRRGHGLAVDGALTGAGGWVFVSRAVTRGLSLPDRGPGSHGGGPGPRVNTRGLAKGETPRVDRSGVTGVVVLDAQCPRAVGGLAAQVDGERLHDVGPATAGLGENVVRAVRRVQVDRQFAPVGVSDLDVDGAAGRGAAFATGDGDVAGDDFLVDDLD